VSHDELRERACRANLAIVEAGLVVLTFGNVSAVDRDAGVLAIKPSGVPYDRLSPDSIVLVDLESGETIGGDLRPSSDTPTHLVLCRRFETIGGIVHTHSPHATSWAQARRPIPCLGTTHADHFDGAVPVTRSLTAAEVEGEYELTTGDVIVETFETAETDPARVPAVLVAGHGPFAWGADEEDAVENAIALEVVAANASRTLALQPEAPELDAALLRRHFERKHGPAAYYGQRA